MMDSATEYIEDSTGSPAAIVIDATALATGSSSRFPHGRSGGRTPESIISRHLCRRLANRVAIIASPRFVTRSTGFNEFGPTVSRAGNLDDYFR